MKKNNSKVALAIIVGLSFLLGLSWGHIRYQHHEIQALRCKPLHFNEPAIFLEIPKWRQYTRHAVKMEVEPHRAEIEAIKQIMRLEREEQLRALQEQVDRLKSIHK